MNRQWPNILIVKLSAIGDVVHTLPALNAIRHYFPQAHITWLVEAAAADLLIGHPALDTVLVSRRKQWIREIKSGQLRNPLGQLRNFISDLRDTRYDMVFDFQAAIKGAMLIAMARGNRKIGFGPGMDHQEHSYFVLNEKIPMISMDVHALDRGLAMIKAVGIPAESVEYRLPVSIETQRAATALITEGKKDHRGPLIAINPIAKWETKLWPADRFSRLADRIIDGYGAAIFFTGGPEDHDIIEGIISSMKHQAFNLAGRTRLIELAALYQQLTCLVTTDTGPMHIAAAVETPVVALFGPTAPWRTGPYGDIHRVITSEDDCRPCYKRSCATCTCMQSITVEQVMEQVKSVLDNRMKASKP